MIKKIFKVFHWFEIPVYIFLLFPLLVLFSNIDQLEFALGVGFWSCLRDSLLQATVSAGICLACGFAGAFGLLSLYNRTVRKQVEYFLLISAILPSFYIILSSLRILEMLHFDKFGFMAVVWTHVFSYGGLCAVIISRILETRLANLHDLAYVEGASRWQFVRAAFPLVRGDFLHVYTTIFVTCFSSFAIPLVLGGGGKFSLDILIYETAFSKGNWGQSLTYILIQSALFFSISRYFGKKTENIYSSDPKKMQLLSHRSMVYVVCVLQLFVLYAAFREDIRKPLNFIFQLQLMSLDAIKPAILTFIFLFFVFMLATSLFAWVTYFYPARRLRKFITGWGGVGSAFSGLAILLVIDPNELSLFYRILLLSAGFLMFSFPSAFRLGGEQFFRHMDGQYEQAKILGATRWQIFHSILWPQTFFYKSSWMIVLLFWAAGDFAFSSIVLGRPITLGTLGYQYLNGYRLESASVIIFFLLLLTWTFVTLNILWFEAILPLFKRRAATA